jgi:hypothetical protein
LSDVLAQRANSNPDKIKIHGVHGGTSRMYGVWKQEGIMLTKVTIGLLAGLIVAAGIARLLATPGTTSADSWPTRPVTMIVPFAAGGPTDVVGRGIAPRLGEILKQQIVVENVGGAGGMTGAQRVALATPDGYQVLLGTVGTQAYNQTLYKNDGRFRSGRPYCGAAAGSGGAQGFSGKHTQGIFCLRQG